MIRAIVVVLLLAATVAGAHQNGYVQDGYTYRDGYWYWGKQAYTLSYAPVQQAYSYYSCGRYYTGYRTVQQATYTEYHPPQPTYDQSLSYDQNLSKLLDIAKQRDTFVLKGQLARAQQSLFNEAVDVLGLRGNFRMENYGLPGYPLNLGYLQANGQGPYGVSGNTVLGYSYQQLADVYGDASLGVLYQQSNRLAERTLQMGEQATAGHMALVEKQGEKAARYMEILAKGKAFADAMKSLEQSGGRIESKETFFKVMPGGKLEVDPTKAFLNMAVQDCGSCHFNGKKAGGFELSMILSDEWRDRVAAYISGTPDGQSGCPQVGGKFAPMPQEKRAYYLKMLGK